GTNREQSSRRAKRNVCTTRSPTRRVGPSMTSAIHSALANSVSKALVGPLPFAHQQPIDAGEAKSAGLQNSTFLQMANQCADGQGGMLQTQLDDRLGCLWAERPTESFVPATLAVQRPVLQTTFGIHFVHAQEHLQLAAPYAIDQLCGD